MSLVVYLGLSDWAPARRPLRVDIDASVAGFLIIPVTKPPFKFAMNAKQGPKNGQNS